MPVDQSHDQISSLSWLEQTFNLYRAAGLSAFVCVILAGLMSASSSYHLGATGWVALLVLLIVGMAGWRWLRGLHLNERQLLLMRIGVALPILSLVAVWATSFSLFLQFPSDQGSAMPGLAMAGLGAGVLLMALLFWTPAFVLGVVLFYSFALLPGMLDQGQSQVYLLANVVILLFLATGLLASRMSYRASRLQVLDKGFFPGASLNGNSVSDKSPEGNRKKVLAMGQQQNGDLHEVERSKNEFLATMSHEIRTPLNSILPILELLRESRLDAEQQEYVATAFNSSRHLMRIIDDILDYSKVESGKLELESIEINVRELVESVTAMMSKSAANRKLQLSATVHDNVPLYVRGDPIRLRQILTNLVSNAIKFTNEGQIQIVVNLRRASRREVELMFAVIDTGIGMSQETSKRLFRFFSQADASTTRKHGGTGLGLAICRQLVELMGGHIGVRSTPGEGATFWFVLPMRKSVRDIPSARGTLAGVRILTFTEDPGVEHALHNQLNDWGIIQERTNALSEIPVKLKSSSALGGSWEYELLFLNITAMHREVVDLITEIRTVPEFKGLRILVATNQNRLIESLKGLSGVYLMGAPVRSQELKRQLKRLLDVEITDGSWKTYADPQTLIDNALDSPAMDAGTATGKSQTSPVPEVLSGHTVLLVEDNPINLAVTKKLLDRLEIKCMVATDGQESLEVLKNNKFDLVLMDCQMPVMDGYQATDKIRQHERENNLPRMPIVALTANAMPGDRQKCLQAGMDDYLSKPLSLDQLEEMLTRWLSRKKKPPGILNKAPVIQLVADAKTPIRPKGGVLDKSVLDELKEIMEDDFTLLIKSYLSNAPELIVQLERALQTKNIEAMILPAHSLKSSSANVGAMQLSKAAMQVEFAAREGDIETASAGYKELRSNFQHAIEDLQKIAG